MNKIVIITIIIVVLVLSAVTVYNNFTGKNEEYKVDIRGTVTDINIFGNSSSILVEGQIENDTQYDKASVRIDENTLITKLNLSRSIEISEINIGDIVEVTFIGPVAESYPVQAKAKLVHIIQVVD